MADKFSACVAAYKFTRQLNKSTRGRAVKEMLYDFLNSDTVAGLDGNNMDAVRGLLELHKAGYAGTVLDALREDA